MKKRMADALASAPRFGEPIVATCKICGGQAFGFDTVDFYRACDNVQPHLHGMSGIAVPYYRCADCDFLFTDFCDDWTSDDFARWIYNDDYIKVDGEYVETRPKRTAEAIAPLFRGLENARILDYGSGHGVFPAAMREHGFSDVVGYDPFSQPTRPSGQFDVVTCFEVIEHSPTPLHTFAEMLGFLRDGGILLFSQSIQPPDITAIRGSWWYLGPKNGHISTYSLRTLCRIGDHFGLSLAARDGLFVLRGRAPNPAFSALETHFTPRQSLTLLASNGSDWHGREAAPTGIFCWTATQVVVWPKQFLLAGCTEISIPFVNQIDDGFASHCRVFVADREVPIHVTRTEIVAIVEVDRALTADIALQQPPLISPASRGVPDARMLGLAVRANRK